MINDPKPYTFDRVVRMVLSAAAIVIVIVLLRYLSDVLLPFAAAVVLAYLLNPLVSWVERKTDSRGLAVGATLGGLGLLGIVLLMVLTPLMLAQISNFRKNVDGLRDDLTASAQTPTASAPLPPVEATKEAQGAEGIQGAEEAKPAEPHKSTLGWSELLHGLDQYREKAGELSRVERFQILGREVEGTAVGQAFQWLRDFLNSNEFNEFVINMARRLVAGGWSVVTFVVSLIVGLAGLIIVLLYLVFLLLNFREYAKSWHTFLPPHYRDSIVEFLEQFDIAMRRYFRGQSLVALLVGTFFSIGFTIIGLPMAVPFGLFVGLLNMVPYLQTVAIIPGVLLGVVRALNGDSSILGSVCLVLLVFGVVQLIQDAVLTPRILGKATGLQPIAVLLGLFVWGKMLGFLGLLLAIPLTCLGIAYYRRFVLLQSAEATKITDTGG